MRIMQSIVLQRQRRGHLKASVKAQLQRLKASTTTPLTNHQQEIRVQRVVPYKVTWKGLRPVNLTAPNQSKAMPSTSRGRVVSIPTSAYVPHHPKSTIKAHLKSIKPLKLMGSQYQRTARFPHRSLRSLNTRCPNLSKVSKMIPREVPSIQCSPNLLLQS